MEKRVSCGEGRWEGLSPEILALIFVRIPPDQMARSIPLVCRGWRDVVAGPYCWAHIDIEQWCRRCNCPDLIDATVRRLVGLSRGTLFSLSAYKIRGSAFSAIANFGKCLKVLKIPVSDVTDQMVAEHAGSLSTVTELDISYCSKITCKGIEVLGRHCKFLIHFRRNISPLDFNLLHEADEDVAMAVANTMPRLLYLELGYGSFSDYGLDAILTKCKGLCHLDIQGCFNVNFDGDLEQRCKRIMVFRGPKRDEYDHEYDSLSDSDDSEGFSFDTEDTSYQTYSDTLSDDSN